MLTTQSEVVAGSTARTPVEVANTWLDVVAVPALVKGGPRLDASVGNPTTEVMMATMVMKASKYMSNQRDRMLMDGVSSTPFK